MYVFMYYQVTAIYLRHRLLYRILIIHLTGLYENDPPFLDFTITKKEDKKFSREKDSEIKK